MTESRPSLKHVLLKDKYDVGIYGIDQDGHEHLVAYATGKWRKVVASALSSELGIPLVEEE